MVNNFSITTEEPNNGEVDVTISHGREGRSVDKLYTVSLEDHAKMVALRDKVVAELAKEEGLPADKTALPIYAALLELNDKGPLPELDKKIDLLKRQVIQGNLDNPAHVAKLIVGAIDNTRSFAERIAAQSRGAEITG